MMPSHPNHPAIKLLQLAARSMDAGRFDEAEAHLQRVLIHEPTNTTALHHLGLRAHLRGQTADAQHYLKRALHAEPNNLPVLTSYGILLHEIGEPREALDIFLRILALDSSLPEIWNAAGICFQETGQPASAVEFYLRAMNLRPAFAEAHSNLGAVLTREGDHDRAIEHLRQALQIDPQFAVYHHNLGTALRNRSQYAAAIASFREALRLDPANPDILGSLGEVLSLIYDDSAETLLRQAVELRPNDPEKHWNLALELLKHGHYTAGWREFDWRWLRPHNQSPLPPFPKPFWRGEPNQILAGTTIFLHAEQGFGDTLQFLRYVPSLLAQGAHIVLGVQPALHRLVAAYVHQLQADIPVIGVGDTLPPIDWHTPLMSLPMACATTLDTIPPARRFTPPAPSRQPEKPLRVGIAWSGNPAHKRDRERSIPIDALTPLFDVPGCSWVSLQVGPAAAQLQTANISIERPTFNDFLDTSTVIDTLDLVIAVDTSLAHLAASQGAPTWLLLAFVTDWRWLPPSGQIASPSPNPWYPQARIFRQQALPDGRPQTELWKPVIAEVARALKELASVVSLKFSA
jgi:tetratricopeptide (TPR) repeat protein